MKIYFGKETTSCNNKATNEKELERGELEQGEDFIHATNVYLMLST